MHFLNKILQFRLIVIIIFIYFISCINNPLNDAKKEVVKVLESQAGERNLEIRNIEIVDSNLVSNHTKQLDRIRFYREYRDMNKKLKELYEKKIELISYDLEELGFGILTQEELDNKEKMNSQIDTLINNIEDTNIEIDETSNTITQIMLNSSNYSDDSVILVKFNVDCVIENIAIKDSSKIYFSRNYQEHLFLSNIFYGINKSDSQ